MTYSTSVQYNRTDAQWTTIQNNIDKGRYITEDPTSTLTADNLWTPEYSDTAAINVTGDFTSNSVTGATAAQGGAVFNGGLVDDSDRYPAYITKYVATNTETGETLEYWETSTANNIAYNISKGKKLKVSSTSTTTYNYNATQWATLLANIQGGQYTTTNPESGLTPDDYYKI